MSTRLVTSMITLPSRSDASAETIPSTVFAGTASTTRSASFTASRLLDAAWA
jgi:hypothetical protein